MKSLFYNGAVEFNKLLDKIKSLGLICSFQESLKKYISGNQRK